MPTFDRREVLRALGAGGLSMTLGRAQEAVPGPTLGARERAALQALVAQQTSFALALHRELSAGRESENTFHSPLSVWTALAMLHAGAQGATRDELAAALRLAKSASGLRLAANPMREGVAALRTLLAATGEGAKLALADAVWFDRGFALNPATREELGATFGADAAGLDFRGAPDAAREHVNRWVAERTAGEIDDLLPPGSVTDLTRLVLTDAIHFLGRWAHPFDAEATREAHFRRPDGSTVAAPFMRLGGAAPLRLASYDAGGAARPLWPAGKGGSTWLELPYVGERVTFVLAMPDAYDGLPALEASLDPETLAKRLAGLAPTRVDVAMPKFGLRPRFELVAPLQRLGVRLAFEAGAADLSGFAAPEEVDRAGLYVTGAFHAAAVTVDEAGTEAAAATGLVVGVKSAPPFVEVARPFLFLIRERESGALLFMGRLTDPSR